MRLTTNLNMGGNSSSYAPLLSIALKCLLALGLALPACAQTVYNLNQIDTGWQYCPSTTCSGGSSPQTGYSLPTFGISNPSLSGSAMELSLSGPSSTNFGWYQNTNFSDTSTYSALNFEFYVPSLTNIQALENDQFRYLTTSGGGDVSQNTRMYFGTQWLTSTHHFQVWNSYCATGCSGNWVDTGDSATISTGAWHHLIIVTHHVRGDTSGSGGYPVMYYDAIILDGTTVVANFHSGTSGGALPSGWTEQTGAMFQLDTNSTCGSACTVTEYIDEANTANSVSACPDTTNAAAYVTPSGSGSFSGADWNDTLAGFGTGSHQANPSSLIRGCTYFPATGSYNPSTITTFSTHDSGSSVITLQAPTSSAHGTSTGWSTGFVGQALFGPATIATDYWAINGAYRGSSTGLPATDWRTGYGFKFVNNSTPGTPITLNAALYVQGTSGVGNYTVEYVEMEGSEDTSGGTNPQCAIGGGLPCSDFGLWLSPGDNATIQYDYVHDTGSSNFTSDNTTSQLIQYSWFMNDQSTTTQHGEGWGLRSSTAGNITGRFNYLENEEGTGYIGTPCPGGCATQGSTWLFYGNVFLANLSEWRGNTSPQEGLSSAIFQYFGNSGATANWTEIAFWNNTCYQLAPSPSSSDNGCDFINGGFANVTNLYVQNNLFVNLSEATLGPPTSGTVTRNYNSYFSVTSVSDTGTGVQNVSSVIPFNAPSTNNLTLSQDTAAWTPLSAPYNVDLLGNARSSSRGAFQYQPSSAASPPTCSPGSGTYNNNQTFSCTNPNSGTTVMCYSLSTLPVTNGAGTGCTTGTILSGSLTVSSSETINVVAGTSTLTDSTEVSNTYTLVVDTPSCTPAAGPYSGAQTMTCTDSTSGASMFYAVGSTPTCSSTAFPGGGLAIAASETVSVIGCLSGYSNSVVASYSYTISFTLAVTVSGGTSSISDSQGGIVACSASTCTASYASGTADTLIPAAALGYYLSGVSGGSCPSSGECTITLSANTAVTYTFSPCNGTAPYPCLRTDTATVQNPSVIPNFGALAGINTCSNDPDFGSYICRATDGTLRSTHTSWAPSCSGDSTRNWNLGNTLIMLCSINAGASLPFTFNTATQQVSSVPTCGNSFSVNGDGQFSTVNPALMYSRGTVGSANSTEILDYNIPTPCTSSPTTNVFYNYTSSPSFPTGLGNATWIGDGGFNYGDTVFGAAFSWSGAQGTGFYAAAYVVGKGTVVWNTQTGAITSDWGLSGTISIPDRFLIHACGVSQDGKWLACGWSSCVSSCSADANSNYNLQLGTLNVTYTTSSERPSGHGPHGNEIVLNNNSPGTFQSRPYTNPAAYTQVINPPSGITALDGHASWNANNSLDTAPFTWSTYSTTTPYPSSQFNEYLIYDPTGTIPTPWRAAHTFNSAQSTTFQVEEAIQTVSQDGNWGMFTSDMEGTLGSASGGATCTLGTDCRGDVFIVNLQLQPATIVTPIRTKKLFVSLPEKMPSMGSAGQE